MNQSVIENIQEENSILFRMHIHSLNNKKN
jgi:hypothetical protein